MLAFHSYAAMEMFFPGGDGKYNKRRAEEKQSFPVVACVAEDGAWAAAWVANGDLFVYRAKGASFPLPHGIERKFRLVVSSYWVLIGTCHECIAQYCWF